MIKALACDIDGTITDEKRRLDPESMEIIRRIEGLGVPVLLATGNILCRTETASTYIGTSGPLIAENGGLIKLRGMKEPLFLCTIDTGEILEAFEHLKTALPVRLVQPSNERLTEIAVYRDFDAQKVRKLLADFKVRVVDTKFAIHITDPDVNKGAAIKVAAEHMKILPEDFAALGDSENDAEMLETAGFSIALDETLANSADIIMGGGSQKPGAQALRMIEERILEERKV